MTKINLLLLLIIYILPLELLNAQSSSEEYYKQDRTSVFYIQNLYKNEGNNFIFSASFWDIKYRMSNYSNELDNFSFTGKLGIQGLSVYAHFGPELKLSNLFFINTTFGIYGSYYGMGIGLVNETELGIRKNILDELYFEGVLNFQIFPASISEFEYFPSLRIGLGMDL